MVKVICNKCNLEYEFKDEWLKKNSPDTFICRKCKIRIKTQSDTFKKKQSAKSKAVLSDPNIKSRMSQIATLNNIRNADKIGKSVKRFYEDFENRQQSKKRTQEKWQDPEYRETVSNGLKEKWKDPEYRGKVLGSRSHFRKRNDKLKNELLKLGLRFELNYNIAHYEFEAFINGIYLYDEHPSNEKRMFIEHYFPDYKYINNLNSISIFGS